ncbi:hypothetical protein [uncultured Rhodospira sp.]|uniref:hypothetical protein n=1 Tax=uncultured Rhodospira sp. TaxID=1936189 RepID=UPI0026279885|nr:hypothetical protein [uncultured Rhodospira sp.]
MPPIMPRPLRRSWTWPAALVAVAALAALAGAVATGALPLQQALTLAAALIGG